MSIPATAVLITVTPSMGALAVTSGRLYSGAVNQVALLHTSGYAAWGSYGVLRLTLKPDQQWSPTLVDWSALCDAIAGVGEEYLGGTLDATAVAIRSWNGNGPKTARLELWDETADLVVAHGQVQLHPSLTYEDDVAATAVPSRGLTDAQITALIVAQGGGKPASEKVTPVDADGFTLWDSAWGWAGKVFSWANLKAALSALYAPIAHVTDAAAHASIFAAKLATSTFTAHSGATSGTHGTTLTNARTPTAHAAGHTDGTDDIATASAVGGGSKGLMSAADAVKLYGIETAADVTDQYNVGPAWAAAVAAADLGVLQDADEVGIARSAALRRYTWSALKTTLYNYIWGIVRTQVVRAAAGSALPTGDDIIAWQHYRLTTADATALAAPGMYMHDGTAWRCLVPFAAYDLGTLAGNVAYNALIGGAEYLCALSGAITALPLAVTRPGKVTLYKSGAYDVALPTMSGRTTVVAGSGGWDAASAALARLTIEDDGTYLICKAEAMS